MKHRNRKPRLGRTTDQRKALVRNLLTSLLTHGSITTTESKAKVLVAELDELVAKVRRQAEQREQIRCAKQSLFAEAAQRNLMEKVLPVAQSRTSGFTRTTRLGPRQGDGAQMISVELFVAEKQ